MVVSLFKNKICLKRKTTHTDCMIKNVKTAVAKIMIAYFQNVEMSHK